MKKFSNLLFVLSIVFSSIFVFYSTSFAEEDVTRTRIDKNTITKGYTVTHNDNDLRFAVTPNQVSQEAHVTLKNIDIDEKLLPAGKKVISEIYSFDMIGLKYNPIVVQKPSWLAVKYNSDSSGKKSLYYWDNNKKGWVKLPSYVDENSGYIKAITHLPYSKIVVLEDIKPKEEYSGLASWYESEVAMTAAMNHYNIGDRVKVTNKENNKSCLVTIIDRGPFIRGRIVDLSNDAFAAIASLSEGIIEAKVESY